MSKNNRRETPGAAPLLVLGAIALALLVGLIYYVQRGPGPRYNPQSPPDVQAEKNKEITYQATVYRDGKLVVEKGTAPSGSDPVVESVNGVLESIPAVPPEARLSETERNGSTLTLKFTSNFDQTYGTDDESNVISGIMKAVDLNSDADTVVFETVTGKPIESLGSVDITGPQSIRDWIGG
ncbi:MAG: hypothetical protein M3R13_05950 [Armatimonadota bacterium]|nr:hypothetical protein [Armatimonadota bacterium]